MSKIAVPRTPTVKMLRGILTVLEEYAVDLDGLDAGGRLKLAGDVWWEAIYASPDGGRAIDNEAGH